MSRRWSTFLVLTGLTPILPTHEVVVTVLLANALTGLHCCSAIIGWELWQIVQARRHGRAGARLHVRIIGLFSVIAAVPAILVAIVASITLDRGLDRWFSTRTRAVIENSLIVAEAYVREHAGLIRGDIVAMAFDVARAKPLFDQDRERFRQFLSAQAHVARPCRRRDARHAIGKSTRAHRSTPRPRTLASAGRRARRDQAAEPRIVLVPRIRCYVAAVIKLNGYDRQLSLCRAAAWCRGCVEQLRQTQASVAEYASLEARRLGVQVAFGLMYTVIALIVLLSAVWIGLNFANRLVAPIRRLIGAANLVSTGNLYVQVPVTRIGRRSRASRRDLQQA